jgi:NTE family protein
MHKNLKIGVSLGGGAARGWSHIGILKTLEAWGIKPDVVTGTSIGALVGAAYVSGKLTKLEQWVLELDKLGTAKYFAINGSSKGFINRKRLQSFLSEYVTDEGLDIEDLDLPFASVATDLHTGQEIWNKTGSVVDAVWASIALPGLFPAIKKDERWLIDGGLVNPVPVSTCRALGADVVIAVNLNSDLMGHFSQQSEPEPVIKEGSFKHKITSFITDYTDSLFGDTKEDVPDLRDAIAATIAITQDRITRSRLAGDPPDFMLSPKLAHIGLLEFYRGKEVIDLGVATIERKRQDLIQLIESA